MLMRLCASVLASMLVLAAVGLGCYVPYFSCDGICRTTDIFYCKSQRVANTGELGFRPAHPPAFWDEDCRTIPVAVQVADDCADFHENGAFPPSLWVKLEGCSTVGENTCCYVRKIDFNNISPVNDPAALLVLRMSDVPPLFCVGGGSVPE